MKWAICILLVCAVSNAAAEVRPTGGDRDARVQSVLYDTDEVIALRVATGFALTIELSPDERIETISLGNSAVWQAVPNRRGDHVFVKPMQGASLTNMTVITDSRRYSFSLEPAAGAEPDLPYIVRITYPPPVSLVTAAPTQEGGYQLRGARALRPSTITDDGRSTAMRWPAEVSLPAVFAVDGKGRETLVNGLMSNGAYSVAGIANRWIFRRGKEQASAVRRESYP